jgi:hypothetical protein
LNSVNFVAHEQSDVGCDLVIARPASVQALAGIAHQFGQAAFDVQVHVFKIELPFKLTSSDFIENLFHAAVNGLQIGSGNNALLSQHGGMGQ